MAGLYEDLDVHLENEDIEKLRSEIEKQNGLLESTYAKNQASTETIQILERNMSALFTTAKLEVKRKDDEILRLRKLLDRERRSLSITQEALECYLAQLQSACSLVVTASQALLPPAASSPSAPLPSESAQASTPLHSAFDAAIAQFVKLADAPFSGEGFSSARVVHTAVMSRSAPPPRPPASASGVGTAQRQGQGVSAVTFVQHAQAHAWRGQGAEVGSAAESLGQEQNVATSSRRDDDDRAPHHTRHRPSDPRVGAGGSVAQSHSYGQQSRDHVHRTDESFRRRSRSRSREHHRRNGSHGGVAHEGLDSRSGYGRGQGAYSQGDWQQGHR